MVYAFMIKRSKVADVLAVLEPNGVNGEDRGTRDTVPAPRNEQGERNECGPGLSLRQETTWSNLTLSLIASAIGLVRRRKLN